MNIQHLKELYTDIIQWIDRYADGDVEEFSDGDTGETSWEKIPLSPPAFDRQIWDSAVSTSDLALCIRLCVLKIQSFLGSQTGRHSMPLPRGGRVRWKRLCQRSRIPNANDVDVFADELKDWFLNELKNDFKETQIYVPQRDQITPEWDSESTEAALLILIKAKDDGTLNSISWKSITKKLKEWFPNEDLPEAQGLKDRCEKYAAAYDIEFVRQKSGRKKEIKIQYSLDEILKNSTRKKMPKKQS